MEVINRLVDTLVKVLADVWDSLCKDGWWAIPLIIAIFLFQAWLHSRFGIVPYSELDPPNRRPSDRGGRPMLEEDSFFTTSKQMIDAVKEGSVDVIAERKSKLEAATKAIQKSRGMVDGTDSNA